mmetsp:Transcript_71148/g.129849  ORF Transcript_71148/g.129849 Transcript_71148/m.129849 type:complete len:486 (+) Transcript_71148:52-1509(+)
MPDSANPHAPARTGSRQILKNVVLQALPSSLASVSQQLTYFITITFVAALKDEDELAACGVGTMLSNVFGLSIGVGLTSGLDTLISQSFGAGDHMMSGLYFQRSIVVSTLACVPVSIFLYFVTPILILLGQDAKVAALAGDLVHGTLLSMWALFVSNAFMAFVRSQRLPNIPLCVSLVSNIFHIAPSYFFIVHSHMGNFGAGLAISMTNWFALVMISAYVYSVRPGPTKYSLVRWSWSKATTNLRSFLAVSLPMAFAIWAEWWCAEFMTLLAGLISPTALAAHTALLSIFSILYSLCNGVQSAACTLVGNAVGAEDFDTARRSAKLSFAVMASTLVFADTLTLILTQPLVSLLSGTISVKEQMISTLPVMLVMMSLDSMQTTCDGVMRGLTKQVLQFRIKMSTMWLIRMPAALLSVFAIHAGIRGLWWSSTMGMAGSASTYLVLFLRLNWQEEVKRASSEKRQRDSLETSFEVSGGTSMQNSQQC